MTKMPTFYISHGGGPWPWVPQLRAIFKNLEASFVQMEEDLPERPKAVVMISGHWEADQVRPSGLGGTDHRAVGRGGDLCHARPHTGL